MIHYQIAYHEDDFFDVDPDTTFDIGWQVNSRKDAFFTWAMEEGAVSARRVVNGVVMETEEYRRYE
jgi:hypothetical protein